MRPEVFEILRCPYCGGRLELVESLFHARAADGAIEYGILGCQCCIFPVVEGIPVLHLQPNATVARDHVQAGHPDLALRAMIGVELPAWMAIEINWPVLIFVTTVAILTGIVSGLAPS